MECMLVSLVQIGSEPIAALSDSHLKFGLASVDRQPAARSGNSDFGMTNMIAAAFWIWPISWPSRRSKLVVSKGISFVDARS